ncbi:MAG: AI-2E family transporter [Bacteroidia bacterium]
MNYKIPFYIKITAILLGIIALIAIMYIGQGIIVPLIGSLLVAILLNPVVNLLIRIRVNRVIAISMVIALVTAVFILLLLLLTNQFSSFINSLPILIDKFYVTLNNLVVGISGRFNISTAAINTFIDDSKVDLITTTKSLIGPTISSIGGVIFTFLLIPVYVFLILYYKKLLLDFIKNIFGKGNKTEVNKILNSTKQIVQRYLVALIFEAIIIAILNVSALLILDVQYAIVVGIIGALLNVIPYIGGIVSTAIPMAIVLATKVSFNYALYVLIAFIIIQFIDNNLVIPKLVASRVRVNALISVIVVIIGGEIWGVTGMFLSIPLTAICKTIFDNVIVLKPLGLLLGDLDETNNEFT